MSTLTPASETRPAQREPVLHTVDRVCELCFGLFMALTFVGAVKAVSAGEAAGHKMFFSALGCNLAWGLADAVMYLIRTLADRGQRLKLILTIRQTRDNAIAVHTLRDALPKAVQPLVDDAELERVRARLASMPTVPSRASLGRNDLVGAVGIFLLVVLGTFPVALPFLVIKDITAALITSRVLTLAMLFAAGYALGRYSAGGGMKAGLLMVAVGVLLTIAIIALGG
ncbi:VIT1/CCC1 transporter family protein [Paraburkholderia sp. SIMBA_009]|uniref:VIT family protein n=1 Tax=Paraburkholderia tropica TaxID=92647 RepID=A0ABX5MRV8_9BURK|nr:VIT1/CCC1 transporter family protein [Paraburkholderia tropica]MDE1143750.1 VIT1/CCC1 transporter family protein [Paraburkholderia tropica]PXX16965.1 VIT family protein [Paraburkholderia tropica]PZW83892.1 VIT family protein [Paraburkholderia tropica]